MSKEAVKVKLRNSIIAVLRCKDVNLAMKMAETIINAGIKAIEVTFTVENAPKLIAKLKEKFPNAIIGAGTVLEINQAQDALKSGAEFIVCPCTLKEIGELCKKNDIFCSMAATTATEVYNSYTLGSDVVKLFPGEFLLPSIIKSFKAPFPFIDFMPTGGIDDKNIKEWFSKGAFAVGAGGYLIKNINEDNLEVLTERCTKLLLAMK